jgi:mono/diheme cytochrome c family protein
MIKQLIVISITACLFFACSQNTSDSASNESEKKEEKANKADEGKGIGEFKNVKLNDPLDETMIATGKGIVDMKCASCHRLNDKRLVGPGFKGVTERRKPEWIMNMITNVDVMLAEDAEAQKLLMECLTRMPNQNVKPEDARAILEFLYKNDSES